MPIVSNSLESSVQANGGTSNVVRMYDQDAVEFTQVFFAPAGFNVQGKIDIMVAELNEHLANREFESLVGL